MGETKDRYEEKTKSPSPPKRARTSVGVSPASTASTVASRRGKSPSSVKGESSRLSSSRDSLRSKPEDEESEGENIFEGVVVHFCSPETSKSFKECRRLIEDHGGEVVARWSDKVDFLATVDEDFQSHSKRIQAALSSLSVGVVHPHLFKYAVKEGRLSESIIEEYRLDTRALVAGLSSPTNTPMKESTAARSARARARSKRVVTQKQKLQKMHDESSTASEPSDTSAKRGGGARGRSRKRSRSQVTEESSSAASEEDREPERVVKDGIPIDELFPKAQEFHVYRGEDEIWDCFMKKNQNPQKFYLMQLLEHDTKNESYVLYKRYGSLGCDGRHMTNYYKKLGAAQAEFEKKFLEKTANPWQGSPNATLQNFSARRGQEYYLEKPDYDPDANEDRIVFLKLLADPKITKQQINDVHVRSDSVGGLSSAVAKKALQLLLDIEKLLSATDAEPEDKTLTDLNKRYNQLVLRKPSTPVLSPKDLAEQVDIVLFLLNVESSHKIAPKPSNVSEIPESKLNIFSLRKDDEMWKIIVDYLDATQSAACPDWDARVRNVFEIHSKAQEEQFKGFPHQNNRYLLWRGCRSSEALGLLVNGLKLPPKECPSSPFAFGVGLQFSDCVSMAVNDCHPYEDGEIGVLLLCEVILGECKEYLAPCKSAKEDVLTSRMYHSVRGVGSELADEPKPRTLDDDLVVPVGYMATSNEDAKSSQFAHNTIVVYDAAQVCIRYAVEVELKEIEEDGPVGEAE